jgi:hypothetical protein
MPVAEAKEPPIAGCAAVRVLKEHMAKEPIFDTGAETLSYGIFSSRKKNTRDPVRRRAARRSSPTRALDGPRA